MEENGKRGMKWDKDGIWGMNDIRRLKTDEDSWEIMLPFTVVSKESAVKDGRVLNLNTRLELTTAPELSKQVDYGFCSHEYVEYLLLTGSQYEIKLDRLIKWKNVV